MPYITKEDREALDEVLTPLLEQVDISVKPGILNYVITKICYSRLFEAGGIKGMEAHYEDYNEVIGVLEDVKLELYRRKVAPYEDKKIKENGDL